MADTDGKLHERLERLESTNRKLVLALGILSGLVGGLILLQSLEYRRARADSGTAPMAIAEVVQAQGFELLDDAGLTLYAPKVTSRVVVPQRWTDPGRPPLGQLGFAAKQ